MATAESVKAKLQGLIDQANATTGGTDADLSHAVTGLIAGYGNGSGGLIIESKNLHNSSTDTADSYLHNGVELTYSGWSFTDYIPTNADTVYAVQCTIQIKGEYCELYDNNKVYRKSLSGGFLSVPGGVSLFTGSGGYIRFSSYTAAITTLSVFECTGNVEFDTEQSAVVALSDDIPAEMALDILTGGGPAE